MWLNDAFRCSTASGVSATDTRPIYLTPYKMYRGMIQAKVCVTCHPPWGRTHLGEGVHSPRHPPCGRGAFVPPFGGSVQQGQSVRLSSSHPNPSLAASGCHCFLYVPFATRRACPRKSCYSILNPCRSSGARRTCPWRTSSACRSTSSCHVVLDALRC